MGRLRLVGSLKLQVTFAKEPYNRDYILQKRMIILRSLLIIATPYQIRYVWHSKTGVTRPMWQYGVATINRFLKIIGLFCKRALHKRRYSAKETYNFKEPTNRSHPILPPTLLGHTHTHIRIYTKTYTYTYTYTSTSPQANIKTVCPRQ